VGGPFFCGLYTGLKTRGTGDWMQANSSVPSTVLWGTIWGGLVLMEMNTGFIGELFH